MKIDKNIDFFVFDLVGVIIDLDIPFTVNQLGKLLESNGNHQSIDFMAHPVHHAFEKGEISDVVFRNEIRKTFNQQWSDQEIDQIWNGMLKNIPLQKIKLLKDLRKTHPVYMLSNTNSIHFKRVEEILLADTGETSFSGLFDHLFLSHEMGCRKPDTVIYEKVLEKIGMPAEKGVFFDDTAPNLIGAEKVGLRTVHINHPNALMDYFSDVH
ncbi:HAD family hydrolase [Echinicola vietnamensis]|uniref:Haloacid dehalogenase superfamily protein, subfamily IA, variant 3 with third motif having DD or ED n=1 Tax=Echinicola vietnamensis (strain DSM 17526 / LMG 23754 / KMM 6221) TaxID=926556 RepID=L0FZZ8_ECHVK|nr:HAD family phosphatase [Echinicola vietnamensis]AGA78882.1 haloacid dehalogenase superfamily protein, subfamily IA, variant 3 with third motif having DD or ED [Echinicola vietnamensis DSM 17526]